MSYSVCRSCGASIRWALTGANHKAIPIDAEPVPDGNIELEDRGLASPYAITWGSSHRWPDDTPRYRSHFATCPHAGEHRRRT